MMMKHTVALVVLIVRLTLAFRNIQVNLGLRLHQSPLTNRAVEGAVKDFQPPIDEKLLIMSKFLVKFWSVLADSAVTGVSKTMTLEEHGLDRTDVRGFLKHFQTCRDCSSENSFVMATKDKQGKDALSLNMVNFPMAVEDEEAEEWGQFDQSDEYLGSMEDTPKPFPVEPDDEIVLRDTKEWVNKVMADFGVCPFTTSASKAGIPSGGVRYTVSRAHTTEEAFLAFWEDTLAMLEAPEKEISTVLLIFPELELFCDTEHFDSYCECLGDALSASSMNMEKELQLVFFHPKFEFRDGQARTGAEQGAANFARRGPWPMVNILRTPQVRAAQKGIPTGQVYIQNEERLNEIGAVTLEKMLYERDWAGLPLHSHKAKKTRERAERIMRKIRSGEMSLDDVEENSFNEIDENNNDHHDDDKVSTRGMSDEDTGDARRREEIDQILAMAEKIEKGALSTEAIAEAEAAMKCPFPHDGTTVTEALPVNQTPLLSPSSPPAVKQLSELERLVENEPQSVDEILKLADAVDRWMHEQ